VQKTVALELVILPSIITSIFYQMLRTRMNGGDLINPIQLAFTPDIQFWCQHCDILQRTEIDHAGTGMLSKNRKTYCEIPISAIFSAHFR